MRGAPPTGPGAGCAGVMVIAVDYGGTLATGPALASGDRPVDGDAVEALWRLHAAGYRLVLASNTVRSRRPALQAAGVDGLFHAVVESHTLGIAKPHPVFYRAVIAAAGVPVHQILHVGNRWDKDVLAPRLAGMAAAFVCPHPLAGRRTPEVLHLARFAELPQALGVRA